MSVMSELAWEIEYRACEDGMSAEDIAKDLNVPIELVNSWFKDNGIWDNEPVVRAKQPDIVFPDGYPFADEMSPYATSNS
jgi:hypothetical protein